MIIQQLNQLLNRSIDFFEHAVSRVYVVLCDILPDVEEVFPGTG
jgi:hypothetical protein